MRHSYETHKVRLTSLAREVRTDLRGMRWTSVTYYFSERERVATTYVLARSEGGLLLISESTDMAFTETTFKETEVKLRRFYQLTRYESFLVAGTTLSKSGSGLLRTNRAERETGNKNKDGG